MKKKKLYIIFAVLVILGIVVVYGIFKNNEQEIYKGTAIITESSLYSKAIAEVKDEEGNVVGKAKVYSEGFLKDDELKVEYTKKWWKIEITKFESDLYKNEDGKTNQTNKDESIIYEFNKPIKIKKLNNADKIDLIASLVKSKANKNFDVNDYIVNRTESSNGVVYYSFGLKISGVKSSIGYVIHVNEEKNVIVSIYDHMKDYITSELIISREASVRSRLDTITESKKEEMRKEAMGPEFTSEQSYRTLGDEYTYYDVKEDKLYYIIDVEDRQKDTGEISAVLDQWTEIK